MYIRNVTIKNIRCFKKLRLSFELAGQRPPWTVLVGDNATGKTTLLRSIAIGLCDETSAAALMRESDEGYIRRDEDEAFISIELTSPKHPKKKYRIRTSIRKVRTGSRTSSGYYEQVKQTIYLREDRRWDDLFACAYGSFRGASAAGDIAGWSMINAVYNIFNSTEGLQNPELVILRQSPSRRGQIKRLLRDVAGVRRVEMTGSGIVVDHPIWGTGMPLRDLADAYKTTMLWLTDFIGWAIAKNPTLQQLSDISGIVLIDEIEQHLHATLQRDIVQRLRDAFPKVQFIATTHSPLIASAIGPISQEHPDVGEEDEARDKLVYLELQEGNVVTSEYLPSLRLRRADQVLASRAFKYFIDKDPSVERVLRRASILAGMKRRNPAREREYERLRRALEEILLPGGQTLIEREIESDRYKDIVRELRELDQERESAP